MVAGRAEDIGHRELPSLRREPPLQNDQRLHCIWMGIPQVRQHILTADSTQQPKYTRANDNFASPSPN